MNEAEWLAATDWRSLLIHLRGEVPPGSGQSMIPSGLQCPGGFLQSGPAERTSRRKLRLFGSAVARGWCEYPLDDVSRALLAVYRAFLDDEGTWDELLEAESRFQEADGGEGPIHLGYSFSRWDDTPLGVADLASNLALATAERTARASLAITCKGATDADWLRWYSPSADGPPDPTFQAARIAVESDYLPLIRDVFGNPFRPVRLNPNWRTSTATALAAQMYDSREFSSIPILADALQDAGCDDADILDHCRGDGPHVRGCWVVDLVLRKE